VRNSLLRVRFLVAAIDCSGRATLRHCHSGRSRLAVREPCHIWASGGPHAPSLHRAGTVKVPQKPPRPVPEYVEGREELKQATLISSQACAVQGR